MIHEKSRPPSTSPLAGQPAPKELLIASPASNANTMRKSPIWGIHLTGVERDWGNGTSPCQHSLP